MAAAGASMPGSVWSIKCSSAYRDSNSRNNGSGMRSCNACRNRKRFQIGMCIAEPANIGFVLAAERHDAVPQLGNGVAQGSDAAVAGGYDSAIRSAMGLLSSVHSSGSQGGVRSFNRTGLFRVFVRPGFCSRLTCARTDRKGDLHRYRFAAGNNGFVRGAYISMRFLIETSCPSAIR